ncbi:MAG: hypothetical protein HUJ51_00810 [Eggerthellaceae bacterium]|nr:hypothetical protein [Eggerthellaceae bacterium]
MLQALHISSFEFRHNAAHAFLAPLVAVYNVNYVAITFRIGHAFNKFNLVEAKVAGNNFDHFAFRIKILDAKVLEAGLCVLQEFNLIKDNNNHDFFFYTKLAGPDLCTFSIKCSILHHVDIKILGDKITEQID